MNNIRSITNVFCHRSHGTFFIRCVPVGPAITHPWRLQFIIKVSARSYLHAMCTCGTLFLPTCTCRTCSYSSVTLAICHKSLRSVLSPSDVYLRDCLASSFGTGWLTCHVYLWDHSPSLSDLWDPMACMSRVPIVGVSTPIPIRLGFSWPRPVGAAHQSICSTSHARKESKLGDQVRSWLLE
jgi:hypothetical protein